MFVYSIVERKSFENLSKWVRDASNFNSKNVVKVLIGNKNDLEDKREVAYEDGKNFADSFGMKFYEVSAKTLPDFDDIINSIV